MRDTVKQLLHETARRCALLWAVWWGSTPDSADPLKRWKVDHQTVMAVGKEIGQVRGGAG